MTDIRDRVKEFMGKHNEEFPAKKVKQSLPEGHCTYTYVTKQAILVLRYR